MTGTSSFELNDLELLDAFGPFVTRRYEPGDPEWIRLMDAASRTQAAARVRRRVLGWLPRFKRTQHRIDAAYSRQWSATAVEDQLAVRLAAPYVFRGQAFEAYTQGEKRLHHRLLFRVLEQLRPRRALELGAGNGLNLLTLAGMCPDVRLTGLELTRGGVEAAARVRGLSELPSALVEFSIEPQLSARAHRRVALVRGTAAALPFPEAAFDLVFTVLALEQMEEIRDRALAELARVARAHVVMIETFRDWNADGIRRDYIAANDYFSASVADLARFGLEPLVAYEVPAKLTRGVGFVVAKVV